MENDICQWVLRNCKFAAPAGPEKPSAVSPAVSPVTTRRVPDMLPTLYQPPGNMPTINTPRTKEVSVGEGLNEDNPVHVPLAQIVQEVNKGVTGAKELVQLASDPTNYPSYAQAFEKAFQRPPAEAQQVLEDLDRLNVFLRLLRGNPALDPRDPRMRQEAKKR